MFCSRLPYTVTLLIFGMMIGAIAQSLVLGVDCPMYALRHDHDGDGMVSRDEWDEFVCAGCDPAAFCVEVDSILNAETFKSCAHAPDPLVNSLIRQFDALDRALRHSALLQLPPAACALHSHDITRGPLPPLRVRPPTQGRPPLLAAGCSLQRRPQRAATAK